MEDKRCKCSFRIKMLGDGCRYCQPQEHIDRISSDLEARDEEWFAVLRLVRACQKDDGLTDEKLDAITKLKEIVRSEVGDDD